MTSQHSLKSPIHDPKLTATRPAIKHILERSHLTSLVSRFNPTEIVFPPETTGFYTDLSIAEYKLRMYALAWTAVEAIVGAGLSVFLILEPIEGSYLPMDTRLTVKENNLLVDEPNLCWTGHPMYLYTQVFGAWEEAFTVEILLPNAHPYELPSLAFVQE